VGWSAWTGLNWLWSGSIRNLLYSS
jgi:hypothetical protein